MPWADTLKQHVKTNEPEALRPGPGTASVLVLIGQRSDRTVEEILLTKRTHLVDSHKGQVSFPGGFWEQGDADSLHTALRETEEEVGLPRHTIEVVAPLPVVQTRGAVPIFPWVARTSFPSQFSINEHEVDKLLYLSLVQLLEQGLQPVTIEAPDYKVKSIGIRVANEMVWGATARVLQHLHGYLRSK